MIAALLLSAVVNCSGNGSEWSGMTLAEPPKSFALWQADDVCNIAIRGVTAQWPDHLGLALVPGTEGALKVEASVRFNSDPLRMRNGRVEYHLDCGSNCTYAPADIVADSGWCLVLGSNGPSRLMGCATAPNAIDGGWAQWMRVCDESLPHDRVSLLTLIYIDPVGTRYYGPAVMVPAFPLDEWIGLSLEATQGHGNVRAELSVSGQSVSWTFSGQLDPDGLAGIQASVMPQTFCTGYYGRPIRSMGMDWLSVN